MLLIFFALQWISSVISLFRSSQFSSCHISKPINYLTNRRQLVMLTATKQTFQLTETYKISEILEYGHGKGVSGVFLIIGSDNKVQFVGASSDILTSLTYFTDKIKSSIDMSIRGQSFSVPNDDAMLAYRSELIRQVGEPLQQKNWNEILKGDVSSATNKDEKDFELFSEKKSSESADKKVTNSGQRLKDIISQKKSSVVESSPSKSTPVIESPFNEPKTNEKIGPIVGLGGGMELNEANVNKVLDEVRPFLIADGGNVAVVEVDLETRDVKLALQGACGSCPSSTTTMKMGIERVLRENFANLGNILAVSPADVPKPSGLTIESVLEALAPVLPAVKSMGGVVEVVAVDADTGSVRLRYKGPGKLKQGIELVLRDMKNVASVEIESF